MNKFELMGEMIKDVPTMHYSKSTNMVYYGVSEKRTTHTIDEFSGKTFVESKEVFKLLAEFYDIVLESRDEIYVIYEQNYDQVTILEAVYSKDIGNYVTTFILKSENPSWFVSYDINDCYIRILFRNPQNGKEKFIDIDCNKIKLKQK